MLGVATALLTDTNLARHQAPAPRRGHPGLTRRALGGRERSPPATQESRPGCGDARGRMAASRAGRRSGPAGESGAVEHLDRGVADPDQAVAFEVLEHLVERGPRHAERGRQGPLRHLDPAVNGLLAGSRAACAGKDPPSSPRTLPGSPRGAGPRWTASGGRSADGRPAGRQSRSWPGTGKLPPTGPGRCRAHAPGHPRRVPDLGVAAPARPGQHAGSLPLGRRGSPPEAHDISLSPGGRAAGQPARDQCAQ